MAYQGIEIIDWHSHFGNVNLPWVQAQAPNYLKHRPAEKRAALQALAREHAIAYNTAWRFQYGFPGPDRTQVSVEELAHQWAAELDNYAIEKIVWVTGMGNETLHKVCQMYPDKFIGMAHHDPFAPDAADEMEKCITQYGFRAFKTIGPWINKPLTDPGWFPLLEVCAAHNVPVLIHFGVLGAGGGITNHINMNPMMLHDAAKTFPDVTFVVPHFGCGYVTDTLMLAWACRNVCIDTSGSNQWVKWVDGDLTTKDLFRKYLETIGPERILFGTDSTWFPRGFAFRYLEDQWRDLGELNVPREHFELIFNKNAKRLLKI